MREAAVEPLFMQASRQVGSQSWFGSMYISDAILNFVGMVIWKRYLKWE